MTQAQMMEDAAVRFAPQPDPKQQIEAQALSWPVRASTVVVSDQHTYNSAAELLMSIKALRGKIEDTFGPIQQKAHAAWKEVIAQRKKVEDPLTEAEATIKGKIGTFQVEQDRIRMAEERRLRDIEERRQAEEIEAQALEAEATGASVEEVTAILEQPIMIAPMMPAPIKATGVSVRQTYKALCTNKMALIKAAAMDPRLLNLLDVNQVALNGFAKAMESGFKVPGCEVYVENIVAARRS